MALMIETDAGSGGARFGYTGKGKKLLWAAGIDWKVSQAGNQMVSVRYACVHDPDGQDTSTQIWDSFVLTQSAAWRIRQFANAADNPEPFDAEDKEAFGEIIARRPVWADIEMEAGYDGQQRAKIKKYSFFGGEITDEMTNIVEDLEKYHNDGKSKSVGRSNGIMSPPDDEVPF